MPGTWERKNQECAPISVKCRISFIYLFHLCKMKALTKYSKDINLQYIHFLKLFWRGIFGIFPMIGNNRQLLTANKENVNIFPLSNGMFLKCRLWSSETKPNISSRQNDSKICRPNLIFILWRKVTTRLLCAFNFVAAEGENSAAVVTNRLRFRESVFCIHTTTKSETHRE